MNTIVSVVSTMIILVILAGGSLSDIKLGVVYDTGESYIIMESSNILLFTVARGCSINCQEVRIGYSTCIVFINTII